MLTRTLPLLPLAPLLAVAFSSTATATTRSGDGAAACTASAVDLGAARRAYAERCELPRVDCDRIDGGWVCSSERIGRWSPGGGGGSSSTPTPAEPVAAPATPDRQDGACAVTAPTLERAKRDYADRCSAPRVDCDRERASWTCASYRIGLHAPGRGSGPAPASESPVTPAPAPVQAPAPSPGTGGGSAPGDVVARAEAESGALSTGWENEGDYIVWRFPRNRYDLSARRDDANIAYRLEVPSAGRYRFVMRSAALEGRNPAEPPNDVWVTFGDMPWTKAWMNRNRDWHVDAIGERGGRKSRSLLESNLVAGPVTVTISGRSEGHAIDWIGLRRVGGAGGAGGNDRAPASGTPTTDDLLALHFDSAPDYDDLQAMVAMRHILDEHRELEVLAVNGTRSYRGFDIIPGSTELMRSLFGGGLDTREGGAIDRVATSWQTVLQGGDRVFLAEAGPSDFTADVLRELQRRGVGGLDRIIVVQHSNGRGWNEQNTRADNLALVKRLTTYRAIRDGNYTNDTSDFNQRNDEFERRALASRYADAWRVAFSKVTDQRRRHDFSDTVELMDILGIPKSAAPDIGAFARRYIR